MFKEAWTSFNLSSVFFPQHDQLIQTHIQMLQQLATRSDGTIGDTDCATCTLVSVHDRSSNPHFLYHVLFIAQGHYQSVMNYKNQHQSESISWKITTLHTSKSRIYKSLVTKISDNSDFTLANDCPIHLVIPNPSTAIEGCYNHPASCCSESCRIQPKIMPDQSLNYSYHNVLIKVEHIPGMITVSLFDNELDNEGNRKEIDTVTGFFTCVKVSYYTNVVVVRVLWVSVFPVHEACPPILVSPFIRAPCTMQTNPALQPGCQSVIRSLCDFAM